tara:strand:- start:106 stop:510 length:405 start_codon:yes stop_codon:yes gene_type:complete
VHQNVIVPDNEKISECEATVKNYQDVVSYFRYLHIFAFIVQTLDLLTKGQGATSEMVFCGPRVAGLISVLSIIIIVDYHSIMAILLKRFNLYPEAFMICKSEYESVASGNVFNEGDFFGEIAVFMTFEAFIFFA